MPGSAIRNVPQEERKITALGWSGFDEFSHHLETFRNSRPQIVYLHPAWCSNVPLEWILSTDNQKGDSVPGYGEVREHNDYKLIRPIASSFHASLHLADWTRFNGFAKKIVVWHVNPRLCRRKEVNKLLLDDLNRAASLNAWQISQILDVWIGASGMAVAVEHISGITLAELTSRRVEKNKPLPLTALLNIFLEIARALEVAHNPHTSGGPIIHGDLKPQWILLGHRGELKITGFGFARFLPAASPKGIWSIWNRRCYQPRERFGPGDPDPRSDIFSLGLLLLEATTGLAPYGTEESATLLSLAQIGADPLPFPFPDEIPEDVEDIIRKACAVEPEDRYASVTEMAADLHRALLDRCCSENMVSNIRDVLDLVAPSHQTRSRLDLSQSQIDQGIKGLGGGPVIHAPKSLALTPPATSESVLKTSEILEVPPTPEPSPTPTPIPTPVSQLIEPQEIWQSSEHVIEAPLVGRSEVLTLIARGVVEILGGEGQVVMIFGDRGMGRSRLISELGSMSHAFSHSIEWLRLESKPEEKLVRHSSIIRLIATAIGLPSDTTFNKIADEIDRLRAFGIDGYTLDTIRSVLGVATSPTDPDRVTGLLSQAAIQCISRLSWEKPTFVVWDDLHWADDASIVCLTELVDQIRSHPVFVLLSARKDFEPPWPENQYLPVQLAPLSREDCEHIALSRVDGARKIEPSLLDALRKSSGGNPLLVQELVDLMSESGLIEIRKRQLRLNRDVRSLPEFDDIVTARLSNLDLTTSSIAVAAAVAGPALDLRVLCKATGLKEPVVCQSLQNLTDHHVLIKKESHYSFPHSRLRQALLNKTDDTVLNPLKKSVAKAIYDTWPEPEESIDDHAASLIASSGNYPDSAKLYLESAKRREDRGDLTGASLRYAKALELARRSGFLGKKAEMALCLRTGRVAVSSLNLNIAEKVLRSAIELADQNNDPKSGAQARTLLCRILSRRDQLKESIKQAKHAINLARRAQDDLTLAEAYASVAETYQTWGQYGPDFTYLKAAFRIGKKKADPIHLARYLTLAVTHSIGVGKYDQTEELLGQVRSIAEKHDDIRLLCEYHKAEGLMKKFSGDLHGALQCNLDGIELSKKHGFVEIEIIMLHNAGHASMDLGQKSQALYYFNESLRRSKQFRFDRMTEANEMFVGFLEATYLNADEGIERLRKAINKARSLRRIWNLTQGYTLLGRTRLGQGDTEMAIQHFEKALRISKLTKVKYFEQQTTMWLEEARSKSNNPEGSTVAT